MKWKGNELLPPLTILRRLTAYPFFMLGRCLLFVSILFALGLHDAKSIWEATR